MMILTALIGVAFILFVLLEAFEALVLPRRVLRAFRFTRFYYRMSWRVWWVCTSLIRSERWRSNMLSYYGPLSLLVLFAIWAATLIFGYALLQFALDPHLHSLTDAFYLSGTTFTTLGYGDVTPATRGSRAVAVAEAANGLSFFAIVIAYLPVLYQTFGRREAFIALLDARAGSPPAAGRMLLRTPPIGDGGTCLTGFLSAAEQWAAEILEAHLSYPVLGYYRSQHDNQSWLTALACTLDVSALLLTVIEGGSRIQARLTFAMARHAAVDLGLVLRRPPALPVTDRLPPERLDELLKLLGHAGVKIRDDADARAKLDELRKLYEPFLNGLSIYFELPITEMWPLEESTDNWRTSAWIKQAAPITSLGIDPKDSHFN
jgi:Ion channel